MGIALKNISHGLLTTFKTFGKHIKKGFVLIIWTIATLIGNLLFFTYPLFAFSQINLAKQVDKKENLSFMDSLQDSNDSTKYNLAMKYKLFSQILFVSGLLIISGISLIIIGISNDMAYNNSIKNANGYFNIYNIIIGVLFLIYVFMYQSIFKATIYFIEANKTEGLSDALKRSLKFYKKNKVTIITTNIVYCLLLIIGFIIWLALFIIFVNLLDFTLFMILLLVISPIFLIYISIILLSYQLTLLKLVSEDMNTNEKRSLKLENLNGLINSDKVEMIRKLFDDVPNYKNDSLSVDQVINYENEIKVDELIDQSEVTK